MRHILTKIFKYILLLIPLSLGIIGYLEFYPEQYTSALYFSIRLFSLNYDIDNTSLILEIARWSAPIFLITWLAVYVKTFYKNTSDFMKLTLSDPILVYGKNAHSLTFCNDLKKNNISFINSLKYKKVKTHVLLFDNDNDNLLFLFDHIDLFIKNDCTVYIHLQENHDILFDKYEIDIFPFSSANATAQLFWIDQSSSLCNTLYSSNKPIDIVIVGDGIYAKNIFEQGLLFNIYSCSQSIHYHLFGNWQEYKALHLYWEDIQNATNNECKDLIEFYDTPWSNHLLLFQKSDKVIICSDSIEENQYIASTICHMIPIHTHLDTLYFHNNSMNHDTFPIKMFGQFSHIYRYDIIIQKVLIERAKKQHNDYVAYQKQNNPSTNTIAWQNLSYFLKLSNIASANFNEYNIKEISKYISTDREYILAKLEHMRWSRFHFLYNWQPGMRNNQQRLHNNLIAFEQLNNNDKNKDINANKG